MECWADHTEVQVSVWAFNKPKWTFLVSRREKEEIQNRDIDI